MFPDDTDPDNPFLNWTEKTAANIPADRRFVQSAGGFKMLPGAVNYIITGAVFAKADSGGATGSLDKLKIVDDQIQTLFDSYKFVVCKEASITVEKTKLYQDLISLFPNPFSDYTILHFSNKQALKHTVAMYDINGRMVRLYENLQGESLQVSKENLSPGIYFIKLSNVDGVRYRGKIIIQ
jgi:hypothetical protein